jgi:hypothetical protein
MSVSQSIRQNCTNPGKLVVRATKFCTVATNIFRATTAAGVTYKNMLPVHMYREEIIGVKRV